MGVAGRPGRQGGARRRPRAGLGRLLPVAGLLLSGCAPRAVTQEGREIVGLYNLFLVLGVIIWALITGLTVWAIVRFRHRDDRLPRQVHGNNRLELAWTLVPLIIVLVLVGYTLRVQSRVEAIAPAPVARIDVLAFQWQWQFTHLGPDGARLRQDIGGPGRKAVLMVPVGQPVRFRLTSADVTHSFFVPRSMYKRMAIPGRVNEFDLTFQYPGRYAGNCPQYCGLEHARMLFDVEAVPLAQYQAWVRGGGGSA